MNPLPCFVCGAELRHCGGPDQAGVLNNQPCGGIYLSSQGNYGSTVYDPMHGSYRLELALCDSCLVKGWARTREVYPKATFTLEIVRAGGETYTDAAPPSPSRRLRRRRRRTTEPKEAS